MTRKIIGIIPARFASTRFPGKPLVVIRGKSMIRRVYEQCRKASCLSDVIVATDDKRIYDHVLDFGGKAVMTLAKHRSGTDRIAEVLRKWKERSPFAVINIQGDEPFIHPSQIRQVGKLLLEKNTQIATLAIPEKDPGELRGSAVVKVVMNTQGEAMLFSRSLIPFDRGAASPVYWRHVGIYGYRTEVLKEISALKPGRLEKIESLEQLRWLEHGYRIRVGNTRHTSFSIDTPEDLLRLPDKP